MSTNIHFDLDALRAQMTREYAEVHARALEATADNPTNRLYVEAQQAFHAPIIEFKVACSGLYNRGLEPRMIACAAGVSASQIVSGYLLTHQAMPPLLEAFCAQLNRGLELAQGAAPSKGDLVTRMSFGPTPGGRA